MSGRREANRQHDAARRHEHPNRKLYSSAQWKALRADQLKKHPLCAFHLKRSKIVEATVVHHVRPKDKDNIATFFRGPSSRCANRVTTSAGQKEDKRGYVMGCDINGVPLDPEHHWNK